VQVFAAVEEHVEDDGGLAGDEDGGEEDKGGEEVVEVDELKGIADDAVGFFEDDGVDGSGDGGEDAEDDADVGDGETFAADAANEADADEGDAAEGHVSIARPQHKVAEEDGEGQDEAAGDLVEGGVDVLEAIRVKGETDAVEGDERDEGAAGRQLDGREVEEARRRAKLLRVLLDTASVQHTS
jgi:hypothetical protein